MENCHQLRLSSGRKLAYTVTGPEDGRPVVYFHGGIGTPVQAGSDLSAITEKLGIRYISPYRPGFGASEPAEGRTVLDHAQDVRELADALELEHFSVVGVSAGGPYALATGYALRSRVTRIAACSSLSPLWAPHRTPGAARRIRWGLSLLAEHPRLVTRIGDSLLPLLHRHSGLVTQIVGALAPDVERDRIRGGRGRVALATRSFLDVAAQGVEGLVRDYQLYAQSWGFPAAEVYNEVQLWHGARDQLIPVEYALQLAASLPHCQVYVGDTEGHHFFRDGLEQILSALVGGSGPESGSAQVAETTLAIGGRSTIRS